MPLDYPTISVGYQRLEWDVKKRRLPRSKKMKSEFYHLRPLNTQLAAQMFDVSIRTIHRYDHEPPKLALMAARYNAGILSGSDWIGWRIKDGELIDPSGNTYSPNTIMSIVFERQLVAELKRKNKKLEIEIQHIKRMTTADNDESIAKK